MAKKRSRQFRRLGQPTRHTPSGFSRDGVEEWNALTRQSRPLSAQRLRHDVSPVPPSPPRSAHRAPDDRHIRIAPVSAMPAHQRHAALGVHIGGVIDLHHLHEQEAFDYLQHTISEGYATGIKRLLVITGKGKSADAPLRRNAPRWMMQWQAWVRHVQPAPRALGGDGAWVVTLHRQ